MAARADYLPAEYDIAYIYSDTPVFAFTRTSADGSDTKLVLINVSENATSIDMVEGTNKVLYEGGTYTVEGSQITLDPYTAVIIQK